MERIKLKNSNIEEVIDKAVLVLSSGGIIVYPTETCYGIGVDATNQAAVDKLMDYKSRREGKPMSVAVTGLEMAKEYVIINDVAENLYENYLPGPLTVVSKSKGKVADGVASEYGTLGIRVPDYELILKISEAFGKPFTSTSANISYKPRPYSIDELIAETPDKHLQKLGLLIDAGELDRNNKPSTVVDTTLNNLNVMREGAAKFNQDLEESNIVLQAQTKNQEETIDFGSLTMQKHIDDMLDQPLVFALKGELGAGKTQFSKGIARKLKVDEVPSSPTFTIIDEYDYEQGEHRKGQFIHMDTWRVDGAEEFSRVGLENYMKAGNVIAIEWADKFYSELNELVEQHQAKLVQVEFEYLDKEGRKIVVYN